MSTSILSYIQSRIVGDPDDESFDNDLISGINEAFAILCQLGIGPKEGFFIENAEPTWEDYFKLIGNMPMRHAIKEYVYIKVRLLFDPPANSFTLDAMKKNAEELEWRLRSDAEFKEDDIYE